MEINIKILVNDENAIQKIKEIFNIEHNYDDYCVKILIMSPPNYKLKIIGPCKIKGYEIFYHIKNIILNKSTNYSCSIDFEEPILLHDSCFEIKFLADNDLNKINLH